MNVYLKKTTLVRVHPICTSLKFMFIFSLLTMSPCNVPAWRVWESVYVCESVKDIMASGAITDTISASHTHTHTHTLITLRAVSTLRFNNTRCQLAERTAKLSRWNSLWCRGQAARLMGMEYSHAQPIRIGEMAFQEHAFISGGVKKHRQKKRHLLAPPCSNKPLKSGLVHRSDRAEDEVILEKKQTPAVTELPGWQALTHTIGM